MLKGDRLLRQTLESALGIKIPYFVEVDYEGFEKVTDALGGSRDRSGKSLLNM